MWISKEKYEELIRKNQMGVEKLREQETKIIELEDKSGHATVKRLMKLAEECQINVHDEEFQGMVKRLFLEVAGRESSVLKGYSVTTFLKDNSEELMERLAVHIKEKNLLTKSASKTK